MHSRLLACGGLLAMTAMTAFGAGCGSGSSSDPFGPEPNYDEVQGRFDHPDGTFDPSKAGSVIGSANGSSDANVGGVFSGGAGGAGATTASPGATTTKVLHILGGNPQVACSDLQAGNRSGSCACPAGGSVAYAIDGAADQSNADFTMKVRLSACAAADVVVDGSEFVHMVSTKNASGQADFRMLFVVDATVTKAGATHTLDIAEEYDTGTLRVAVKVDDGWVAVVVQTSGSGTTYQIKDKNGTWTCAASGESYTCSH